ncbi:unnamed protein product [Caenorhabditis brenneri]
MVSLRSGKRTVRPTPASTEQNQEQAPEPTETPKKRGRVAKNAKQVFDKPEEAERLPEVLEELKEPHATSETTPELDGADEDLSEPTEPKNARETTPDIDETREVSEDVFATSGNSNEESDNEYSSEDEPMEVSSKKQEVEQSLEDEIVSDSADDEPMECTSKKVEKQNVEDAKSLVEKLLERKAEKTAKLTAKKLKKRSKKKESKKVADGVFEVRMKKSKSKFNVVTLKDGIQHMLEPEINFREELLKSRTAGSRVADTDKFLQRSKWVSKR